MALVAVAAVLAAVAVATIDYYSREPGAASASTSPASAHQRVSASVVKAPASVAPSVVNLTPMGRSRPVRLKIPAIGVSSDLIALGLQADGTLEVPPNGFPAGWYTGAPTPGQVGPAIIAGHVRWDGRPGVFYNLAALRPDDQVMVTREDGSVAVFRVSRVAMFAKDTFPTDAVYGNIDHPGLRLITCGGLNQQTDTYDDNTIVFADLVAAR